MRTIATAVALLGLLFLVNLAGGYTPALVRAMDVRGRAQVLADDVGRLQPGDVTSANVAQLRARVDALGGDIGWFRVFLATDPLLGVARGLGVADVFVRDATTLLLAADDLANAAGVALDLADRFVAIREQPGTSGPSLISGAVELLATSTADIDEAHGLMVSAGNRLRSIPDSAQSDIREAAAWMRSATGRYSTLLDQIRQIDQTLPGIVGWRDPKRYLVLAQNPAELRPSGGFAGTVGIVGFADGALTERTFQDVYEFDLRPGIPFVEPPRPLANHLLGGQSWKLADANWSPDFPTAAQKALELYTLESGDTDVDGVIALTTYAVDRLLEVTGPVEVPEYSVTVRPGEVTLTALRLTRGISTPDSDRKAFLEVLATTVLERL